MDSSGDTSDINRDIRTARVLARYGPCRYRRLLDMRLGDVTQTSAAVGRLKRAGYVVGDDRELAITPPGRAALARLDDPTTRSRLLTHLFYEGSTS
jgi:hypothetical protein